MMYCEDTKTEASALLRAYRQEQKMKRAWGLPVTPVTNSLMGYAVVVLDTEL